MYVNGNMSASFLMRKQQVQCFVLVWNQVLNLFFRYSQFFKYGVHLLWALRA